MSPNLWCHLGAEGSRQTGVDGSLPRSPWGQRGGVDWTVLRPWAPHQIMQCDEQSYVKKNPGALISTACSGTNPGIQGITLYTPLPSLMMARPSAPGDNEPVDLMSTQTGCFWVLAKSKVLSQWKGVETGAENGCLNWRRGCVFFDFSQKEFHPFSLSTNGCQTLHFRNVWGMLWDMGNCFH